MDYRQLLSQANALAAYGYSSPAYHSTAANNARTYSYRLWTLANVLTEPCVLTYYYYSFFFLLFIYIYLYRQLSLLFLLVEHLSLLLHIFDWILDFLQLLTLDLLWLLLSLWFHWLKRSVVVVMVNVVALLQLSSCEYLLNNTGPSNYTSSLFCLLFFLIFFCHFVAF